MMIMCLIMGFGPMLAFLAVVWWLDRWEREPVRLVWLVFTWGALPAFLGALALQVVAYLLLTQSAGRSPAAAMATISTVVAPATEELLKAVPLLLLMIVRRSEMDSWYDGVVYGASAGFGFAAVENVLYFLQSTATDGGVAALVSATLARAIAFGPLHALCSAMSGAGCSAGRLATRRIGRAGWPIAGILAAIAVHTVHNVMVGSHGRGVTIWAMTTWSGVISLLALAALSIARQRELILAALEPEIAAGTLQRREAEAAFMPRRIALTTLFPSRGVCSIAHRYHSLTSAAADLAFARNQQERFGSQPEDETRLTSLRERVRAACDQLRCSP
jgi:protease PrsW